MSTYYSPLLGDYVDTSNLDTNDIFNRIRSKYKLSTSEEKLKSVEEASKEKTMAILPESMHPIDMDTFKIGSDSYRISGADGNYLDAFETIKPGQTSPRMDDLFRDEDGNVRETARNAQIAQAAKIFNIPESEVTVRHINFLGQEGKAKLDAFKEELSSSQEMDEQTGQGPVLPAGVANITDVDKYGRSIASITNRHTGENTDALSNSWLNANYDQEAALRTLQKSDEGKLTGFPELFGRLGLGAARMANDLYTLGSGKITDMVVGLNQPKELEEAIVNKNKVEEIRNRLLATDDVKKPAQQLRELLGSLNGSNPTPEQVAQIQELGQASAAESVRQQAAGTPTVEFDTEGRIKDVRGYSGEEKVSTFDEVFKDSKEAKEKALAALEYTRSTKKGFNKIEEALFDNSAKNIRDRVARDAFVQRDLQRRFKKGKDKYGNFDAVVDYLGQAKDAVVIAATNPEASLDLFADSGIYTLVGMVPVAGLTTNFAAMYSQKVADGIDGYQEVNGKLPSQQEINDIQLLSAGGALVDSFGETFTAGIIKSAVKGFSKKSPELGKLLSSSKGKEIFTNTAKGAGLGLSDAMVEYHQEGIVSILEQASKTKSEGTLASKFRNINEEEVYVAASAGVAGSGPVATLTTAAGALKAGLPTRTSKEEATKREVVTQLSDNVLNKLPEDATVVSYKEAMGRVREVADKGSESNIEPSKAINEAIVSMAANPDKITYEDINTLSKLRKENSVVVDEANDALFNSLEKYAETKATQDALAKDRNTARIYTKDETIFTFKNAEGKDVDVTIGKIADDVEEGIGVLETKRKEFEDKLTTLTDPSKYPDNKAFLKDRARLKDAISNIDTLLKRATNLKSGIARKIEGELKYKDVIGIFNNVANLNRGSIKQELAYRTTFGLFGAKGGINKYRNAQAITAENRPEAGVAPKSEWKDTVTKPNLSEKAATEEKDINSFDFVGEFTKQTGQSFDINNIGSGEQSVDTLGKFIQYATSTSFSVAKGITEANELTSEEKSHLKAVLSKKLNSTLDTLMGKEGQTKTYAASIIKALNSLPEANGYTADTTANNDIVFRNKIIDSVVGRVLKEDKLDTSTLGKISEQLRNNESTKTTANLLDALLKLSTPTTEDVKQDINDDLTRTRKEIGDVLTSEDSTDTKVSKLRTTYSRLKTFEHRQNIKQALYDIRSDTNEDTVTVDGIEYPVNRVEKAGDTWLQVDNAPANSRQGAVEGETSITEIPVKSKQEVIDNVKNEITQIAQLKNQVAQLGKTMVGHVSAIPSKLKGKIDTLPDDIRNNVLSKLVEYTENFSETATKVPSKQELTSILGLGEVSGNDTQTANSISATAVNFITDIVKNNIGMMAADRGIELNDATIRAILTHNSIDTLLPNLKNSKNLDKIVSFAKELYEVTPEAEVENLVKEYSEEEEVPQQNASGALATKMGATEIGNLSEVTIKGFTPTHSIDEEIPDTGNLTYLADNRASKDKEKIKEAVNKGHTVIAVGSTFDFTPQELSEFEVGSRDLGEGKNITLITQAKEDMEISDLREEIEELIGIVTEHYEKLKPDVKSRTDRIDMGRLLSLFRDKVLYDAKSVKRLKKLKNQIYGLKLTQLALADSKKVVQDVLDNGITNSSKTGLIKHIGKLFQLNRRKPGLLIKGIFSSNSRELKGKSDAFTTISNAIKDLKSTFRNNNELLQGIVRGMSVKELQGLSAKELQYTVVGTPLISLLQDNKGKWELPEIVQESMMVGLVDFIHKFAESTLYNTPSDIAGIFGYTDKSLVPDPLLQVGKDIGLPLEAAVVAIGRAAVKTLGIRSNDITMVEKLEHNLGNLAIQLGIAHGVFKPLNQITNKEIGKLKGISTKEGDGATRYFIRVNGDISFEMNERNVTYGSRLVDAIFPKPTPITSRAQWNKLFNEAIEDITNGEVIDNTQPLTKPIASRHVPKDMGGNSGKLSKRQTDTVKKHNAVEYGKNSISSFIDWVFTKNSGRHGDELDPSKVGDFYKLIGVEDPKLEHVENRPSTEGRNLGLITSVSRLLAFISHPDAQGGVYFPWRVHAQGRYGIDRKRSAIDVQQDPIHRYSFGIMGKGIREYNLKSEEDLLLLAKAFATGFEDIKSIDELNAGSLTSKDLLNKYLKTHEADIEAHKHDKLLTHLLAKTLPNKRTHHMLKEINLIINLTKLSNAFAEEAATETFDIIAENDGTNQGFALNQINYGNVYYTDENGRAPTDEEVAKRLKGHIENLNSVGVTVENMGDEVSGKHERSQDAYTRIRDISNKLFLGVMNYESTPKEIVSFLAAMNALGSVELTTDPTSETATVELIDRDGVKYPLMIFNYGAQKDRVAKEITKNLEKALYRQMAAINNEEELIKYQNLVKSLGLDASGLDLKNTKEFKFDDFSKFRRLVQEHYSDTIFKVIEETAPGTVKTFHAVNELMHQIGSLWSSFHNEGMLNIFNKIAKDSQTALNNEADQILQLSKMGSLVTNKEISALEDAIGFTHLIPTMSKDADADGTQGIATVDTVRRLGNEAWDTKEKGKQNATDLLRSVSTGEVPITNISVNDKGEVVKTEGTAKQITNNVSIDVYEAKKVGAVGKTQSTDAFLVEEIMREVKDVLAIHDGFVRGEEDADGLKAAYEGGIKASFLHDHLQTLIDKANTVIGIVSDPNYSTTLGKFGITDINMQLSAIERAKKDLEAIAAQVNKTKEELGTLTFNNLDGVANGETTAKFNETTNTSDSTLTGTNQNDQVFQGSTVTGESTIEEIEQTIKSITDQMSSPVNVKELSPTKLRTIGAKLTERDKSVLKFKKVCK